MADYSNLAKAIRRSLESSCSAQGSRAYSKNITNTGKLCDMVIPVGLDTVEIPVFVLGDFAYITGNSECKNTDAIVVNLMSFDVNSSYKSLDADIRNTLYSDYRGIELRKLLSTSNYDHPYYITRGIIFNDRFQPVLMLSWQLEKTSKAEEDPVYTFSRPILRIHPDIFINKGDAMERFIVNKILPAALNVQNVYTPFVYSTISCLKEAGRVFRLKVEIDRCPFTIETPDVPSITTENKELLNIALTHIDEALI